jgi:hypothetical protein
MDHIKAISAVKDANMDRELPELKVLIDGWFDSWSRSTITFFVSVVFYIQYI